VFAHGTEVAPNQPGKASQSRGQISIMNVDVQVGRDEMGYQGRPLPPPTRLFRTLHDFHFIAPRNFPSSGRLWTKFETKSELSG